ncbi:hypothetical protein [Sphingomonas jatrophae]|uniref:Glycerophosphoryl diester phosphodiesterase membrane domain-containing protein n=1 Tax=Sphingomonas jatrophae TaxID=1166337 RepID=A0A1I6K1K6_9SPHN|nr:hypothetical protein [Sphingomonas jatrophae]SFR85132.1 hypothetical protein SAMN05192580_1224 [Sphingomonas jatrophae]
MARAAMGDVWEDTRRFVAREAALLFPLALATVGLATLLYGLAVPEPTGREIPIGPWAIVLLPVLLLLMLGALSISSLVLNSGGSVGEALRAGLRRLGGAVVAMLLAGVAMTAALLAATLVGALVAVLARGGEAQAATASMLLFLPLSLWLAVRFAVLMPLLAAEPPTLAVLAPLRRAFALTRGHAGGIAWVALVYALASGLVTMALQFSLGTILLLVTRLLGVPAAGVVLTAVVTAIVVALLQAVSLVFQAMLFRRLAGAA